MYDLLLKGGLVVDPAENINGSYDVAVSGGKIANIATTIDTAEAAHTIRDGHVIIGLFSMSL